MREAVNRPSALPYVDSEGRALETLRFLLIGSRGGENRGRILRVLASCPRNAYDIARELDLNYGTVTHHLKTLAAAGLVIALTGSRYAQGFALSPVVRRHEDHLRVLLAGNGHEPLS